MIEVRDLTKIYKKTGVTALDNVSFTIPDGKVTVLLGPNGAGKTTLIKIICGLILPDGGDVTLNGVSVVRNRGKALKHLSVVLEGDRNLFYRLTGWQNIEYFLSLQGVKLNKSRAKELAKKFGILDALDHEVRMFSKGMKQKLSLLISFLPETENIILDEPTVGVDVISSIEIRKLIKHIAEEGRAILLTTHEMLVAREVADKTVFLNKGKVILETSMKEIFERFSGTTFVVKFRGIRFQGAKEIGDDTFEITTSDTKELSDHLSKLSSSGAEILEIKVYEKDLEKIFLEILNA